MHGLKKIVTIQDLSCYGKCALTIALPVLSAAGVQACPVPTALLSTHTGGFGKPAVLDLTGEIDHIAAHWQSAELYFDTVMTGYLAGQAQIEAVERFFERFPQSRRIVDPVMGDNGRYYSGFDDRFAQRMAQLCKRADVILPNLTEAAFLLGIPCQPQCGAAYAEQLARRLAQELGVRAVVLTGVQSEDGARLGAGVLEDGRFTLALAGRVNAVFHGSGDLFAAVFAALVTRGCELQEAAQLAASFTAACIAYTAADPGAQEREGLRFEPLLGRLAQETDAQCGRITAQ